MFLSTHKESGIVANSIPVEYKALAGKLKDHLPVEITAVNRTELEPLWDYMVKSYHYLGYKKMIGPRIKYLARFEGIPIAALSYKSAFFKVAARDDYIGWSAQQKNLYLKHVVNNNRFLILPWVKVKNLASHLLSRTLKMLQSDWPERFGAEPYLVETFVDESYEGTCYRAANWIYLGETSGFAKIGSAFTYHGRRKSIYLYVYDEKKLKNLTNSTPCHRTLQYKRERVPNMMLHTPTWDPKILEEVGINEDEISSLGDSLEEYLAIYQPCYARKDQRKHGETFVKGLLSDLKRKSIEPIALENVGPKGVRPLQIFFKHSPVDDEMMLHIYQQRLASNIASPKGMINTDASDFVKKGKNSVGVYRQYCGAIGKVENCQSGVFVGYSSENGYGLVDRRLFIPEAWFGEDYADLRHDCGVPEDLTFKTRIELAAEMITRTVETGLFPARWIGCDSFFGRSKEFLASLPEGYYYFADIPENTMVWPKMPEVFTPKYSGRGPRPTKPMTSTAPVPVSQIAEDENIPWQQKVLGEGAKGPIVTHVKVLRVVEAKKDSGRYLPYRETWLYIRSYENGRVKYAFSNAPADMKQEELDQAALMRWPIEQCFEECKSYLGMKDYETRSWIAWHRHMMYVFIAHLFITELRLKFKKNTYFDHATGEKACHRSSD